MTTSPLLPGRLGTPNLELRHDPRADPRMLTAMAAIGLDVAPPASPVTAESPLDEILENCMLAEAGFQMAFGMINQPSTTQGVSSSIETITGVDGNDITLYIHRPDGADGPLPCVVHTHGGGMAILQASDPGYVRWRDELAATGLVVVGVEFRNAAGVLGPHPFPAGLNDCASAAQWVIANREALGVSTVIISGESGGGNLSIATALKAKRDGWIDGIGGVYAQCPYISGSTEIRRPSSPRCSRTTSTSSTSRTWAPWPGRTTPTVPNATNPLAWPMHAAPSDLEGLPPHVISVNQLDPLRDEGLVYFRKLLDAGVSAVSRTVNGTCHAGDCLFADAMPDVFEATIRDIKGFADSL